MPENRIEALEAENFRLAAGQCVVENGLIGDEHGHFGCSLEAETAALGELNLTLMDQLNEQDALIAELAAKLEACTGYIGSPLRMSSDEAERERRDKLLTEARATLAKVHPHVG
jgi:hypothetical protein